MTIGGSILLIVVGAILYFATNLRVSEIELDTVGLILMIAGLAGLVIGLVLRAGDSRRARREVIVEDRRERLPPT